MIPAPTQKNIQEAMRAFLVAVLDDGVEVRVGQGNNVPEPRGTDFVVMTPMRFQRLRTNVDSDEDVKFTGSIVGTTLTVAALAFGAIEIGATIFGVGVLPSTRITARGTGSGGVGTYTVSRSQTVGSETLSSGAMSLEQGAEVVVQLDFHSDSGAAGDMAQAVSTLLRDPFGVEQFASQDPQYGVVPLYADDPKQAPFINAEQQYEWRWTLEACLQVNQQVSVPQQYSDGIDVDVISVDAEFPP